MIATMPQHDIENINEKLDKIMSLLYNDVETNRKGLVQKLDDLEKVVDSIILSSKIFEAKKSVWIIVLGSLGAGLAFVVKFLINLFFLK